VTSKLLITYFSGKLLQLHCQINTFLKEYVEKLDKLCGII